MLIGRKLEIEVVVNISGYSVVAISNWYMMRILYQVEIFVQVTLVGDNYEKIAAVPCL